MRLFDIFELLRSQHEDNNVALQACLRYDAELYSRNLEGFHASFTRNAEPSSGP